MIPTHNGKHLTRRCLISLNKARPDGSIVIVVDDGSTDGTSSMILSQFPDVIVIRADGTLWWSGAANLGCEEGIRRGAEWLLLLNNDNVDMSPNLIRDLGSLCLNERACVSPLALSDDLGPGRRVLQAGGKVNWRDRGAFLAEWGALYEPSFKVEERDFLVGHALAITAKLFRRLDGFDATRFPQYRADADFTLRARAVGARCLVSYRSWVLNDRSQTGLNVERRISLRTFLNGFVSLRSSYHVPSTLRFGSRHCPLWLRPWYFFQLYGRYVYATLKTQPWWPHWLTRRRAE